MVKRFRARAARVVRVWADRRRYTGPPPEQGGTSIAGKVTKGVVQLFSSGKIQPGQLVLDYGAGKYARNADWLREQGVDVYAYDPYNATGGDGWEMGEVAAKVPSGTRFDVAFSAYVLNVVPEPVEDRILGEMKSLASKTFHITRNKDIFQMAKKSLEAGREPVTSFFLDEFATEEEALAWEMGELTDETIMDFCLHGVTTSRGFQRIPLLEEKGGTLVKATSGFKIYEA